jgi:hypothetical protein
LLQETFCYGDVLLRRRFVWRRFVEETFCAETFCAETFCMCAILSDNTSFDNIIRHVTIFVSIFFWETSLCLEDISNFLGTFLFCIKVYRPLIIPEHILFLFFHRFSYLIVKIGGVAAMRY